MNVETLAKATELMAQINSLKGVLELVEDESTGLLYVPESHFREDAPRFPEFIVPDLRAHAVQLLREHIIALELQFADL